MATIDSEELKPYVHKLNNLLQTILGYIELGQYAKAIVGIADAAMLLRELGAKLAAAERKHKKWWQRLFI